MIFKAIDKYQLQSGINYFTCIANLGLDKYKTLPLKGMDKAWIKYE